MSAQKVDLYTLKGLEQHLPSILYLDLVKKGTIFQEETAQLYNILNAKGEKSINHKRIQKLICIVDRIL